MRFFPQKNTWWYGVLRPITTLAKHIALEKLCSACHRPFHAPFSQESRAARRSVQNYLCPKCVSFVQKEQRASLTRCTLCGHALPEKTRYTQCLHCQAHPPPWDALSFYASYESLVKYCILQYKYGVKISFIPVLRSFLYEASLSLPPCDILIPLPRHKKRLASQGYNHMLELAHSLQKWLVIPLEARALWRTRFTVPQMSLPKAQRHANPRKSFAAQDVKGKRVLLLDDVITTGATLHHACLALRRAGAAYIAVLVVARAEKEL